MCCGVSGLQHRGSPFKSFKYLCDPRIDPSPSIMCSGLPLPTGPGTAQQTVSIGTRLEVVVVVLFVQVLFVIDSPIEGSPCDELECCGPCVVFVNERPVFEFHKRFMAAQTCGGEMER
uniref:Uncharacterized protein n=1 Tax=Anopheles melas TaxID=34690 RepID=A0A182TZ45_9DIPT